MKACRRNVSDTFHLTTSSRNSHQKNVDDVPLVDRLRGSARFQSALLAVQSTVAALMTKLSEKVPASSQPPAKALAAKSI